MKILTRKKQNEIIKLICVNEIIFINQNKDPECSVKYIDNSTEIAELVGGYDGAIKYLCTMKNYIMNRGDKNANL